MQTKSVCSVQQQQQQQESDFKKEATDKTTAVVSNWVSKRSAGTSFICEVHSATPVFINQWENVHAVSSPVGKLCRRVGNVVDLQTCDKMNHPHDTEFAPLNRRPANMQPKKDWVGFKPWFDFMVLISWEQRACISNLEHLKADSRIAASQIKHTVLDLIQFSQVINFDWTANKTAIATKQMSFTVSTGLCTHVYRPMTHLQHRNSCFYLPHAPTAEE